ncbi:MAG: hypothetical protein WBW04_09735 [Nitrolancea sp.]
MADTGQTNDAVSQDISITVVSIPQQRVAQVLDFVEKLEQEDTGDDVSGHMLSRGVMSAAKGISGTGCKVSGGTFNPNDFHCSDSDES